MNMTHYMSLLTDNQPWDLIIFIALPSVLHSIIYLYNTGTSSRIFYLC